MVGAAADVLGYLPGPVSKANLGACAMFGEEVFAFAVASAVAVVDVRRLQLACVLHGMHQNATVSALSWCPEMTWGDLKSSTNLRLASGDSEGRVVLWDLGTGVACALLDDPLLAATGISKKAEPPKGGAVRDLAWLGSSPALLAIVLASGLLIVWDPRPGGGVAYKKDFGPEQSLTAITVDPTDCRRCCLVGQQGHLHVLRLLQTGRDRVEAAAYRVDFSAQKPSDVMRAAFSTSQDLLYVLLPREIIVFDLEFGQPAASTTLGASRSPFKSILGSYGHGNAGRGLHGGGIDLLYCSHQDGSVSVWKRADGHLTYSLAGLHKLVPPPSRVTNNATVNLLSMAAAPWQRCLADAPRDTIMHSLASAHPSRVSNADAARVQTPTWEAKGVKPSDAFSLMEEEKSEAEGHGRDLESSPVPIRPAGVRLVAQNESLLVMAVTDEGHVWQWDMPLHSLHVALFPPKPVGAPDAYPPAQPPALVPPKPPVTTPLQTGILHMLPHNVTTFAVCGMPVEVGAPPEFGSRDGDAVGVVAAATAAGSLEFVTLQRGLLAPLTATVSISLSLHKDVVRGVRWMGPTPRVASFTSEKLPNGYRNTLLLTDVRNRASIPFREVGLEAAPLQGIRASPTGRYLLLLLRGAPSEIWAVGGGSWPSRVRVLDLPFTAVEWVIPGTEPPGTPAEGANWTSWDRSPNARSASVSAYLEDFTPKRPASPSTEDLPEERLAFALGDGRVGVLAVKGRKVSDTKPKRPQWPLMSGASEAITTAVAGWGHIVLLGDADGNLSRWDTLTGKVSTISSTQGAVRRIQLAPPPAEALVLESGGTTGSTARVAVLFANGAFGVWELDRQLDLAPGSMTVSASAKLGKAIDVAWAPLPAPVGGGSVLLVATEDGALAAVDATQAAGGRSRRERLAAFKQLAGGSWPFPQGGLAAPDPVGSSLLLPRAWAALLRLMLQQGVPIETLRALSGPPAAGDEALEESVWAVLPDEAREAWLAGPHRMYTSEAQEITYLAGGWATFKKPKRTSSMGTESRSGDGAGLLASPRQQLPDQASVPDWATSWAFPEASSSSPAPASFGPVANSGLEPVLLPIRTSGTDERGAGAGGLAEVETPDNGHAISPDSAARFKAFRERMSKITQVGANVVKGMSLGGFRSEGPGEDTVYPPVPSGSLDREPRESGGPKYEASLALTLRALAHMRAGRSLLHGPEWDEYAAALRQGSAAKAAVAAAVAGNPGEARFWRALPTTLDAIRTSIESDKAAVASQAELAEALSSKLRVAAGEDPAGVPTRALARSTTIAEQPIAGPPRRLGSKLGTAEEPFTGPSTSDAKTGTLAGTPGSPASEKAGVGGAADRGWLWDGAVEVAEARERAMWHEAMSRRSFEEVQELQERRVIEYVVLGDFTTAVGFLLASTPARTARYYRDALLTLALAASSREPARGAGGGLVEGGARSLHIQAAKVVTAHAASVGDVLLGVPLLVSAGLPQEAAVLLQEAGLWRYAATLAANMLSGDERAASLERWASHLHQAEGKLWAAMGVLVAGGALRTAVLLLRKLGLAAAAFAFVAACSEAGFRNPNAAADSGGLDNLFHHSGNTPLRRGSGPAGDPDPLPNAVDMDFARYCADLLQQL
eukprot:jgi/Botrbrau1/5103/Bobra.0128s0014.1